MGAGSLWRSIVMCAVIAGECYYRLSVISGVLSFSLSDMLPAIKLA
jgi:hypothetical protein